MNRVDRQEQPILEAHAQKPKRAGSCTLSVTLNQEGPGRKGKAIMVECIRMVRNIVIQIIGECGLKEAKRAFCDALFHNCTISHRQMSIDAPSETVIGEAVRKIIVEKGWGDLKVERFEANHAFRDKIRELQTTDDEL